MLLFQTSKKVIKIYGVFSSLIQGCISSSIKKKKKKKKKKPSHQKQKGNFPQLKNIRVKLHILEFSKPAILVPTTTS